MGLASIASDLNAAKDFYTKLYPYPVEDNSFAGIRFFSIMKGGDALISVFERTEGNPITGTLAVLRVDSVHQSLPGLQQLGVDVIIPPSFCPCTQTHFALCADKEGNQFIIKEAAGGGEGRTSV